MRVIAGKAKGKQLKTPEGMLTRPTTDRVKEALFSISAGYPRSGFVWRYRPAWN